MQSGIQDGYFGLGEPDLPGALDDQFGRAGAGKTI
jgi:hypothetical protein